MPGLSQQCRVEGKDHLAPSANTTPRYVGEDAVGEGTLLTHGQQVVQQDPQILPVVFLIKAAVLMHTQNTK